MTDVYLAIDFGGGSGRVIAGYPSGDELVLDTVYRFPNRQVKLGAHVYWDFLSLFEDMKRGIRMAHEKGYRIKSIGIDTWGVDFGLIDKQGNLLGNPVCYRDRRTEGLSEEVFARVCRKEHYARVGTQVMDINTLFQLYAMKKNGDPLLEVADKLLFMPDLFSFFLTGVANNEYSIASTSEMLDARSRQWDWKLMEELGLPAHLFGEIVMPGTGRGKVKPEILEELGIGYDIEVVAVASHDTASAVSVVTEVAGGEHKAFLSSGTWSLLGVTLDEPVLTEEARKAGFTNEGGSDGKICFLQNITGLWILQRLFSQWKDEGKDTSYERLIPLATKTEFCATIDVDDASFQNPICMSEAINRYCEATGQPVPVSQGEYVRCILLSLAERYRKGIEELNRMLPQPVTCLHIIGGGSQNGLLNDLTGKLTGLKVETGPVEATAIGNIRMQMKHV
ncbi:rhamnulokinase family protein [Phocaeicola sp. HCN-40430]|uniref:rhamnulokinase n=1 Tax=Phocaeicola sp. HCN-40430 TaxID=3134664 RepID=UPI0030C298CD